jgi:hypothetical protein
MKELFRKIPSKELVEEILIHLQFLGFNDNRIFTKFDIPKERFNEILVWVEPYYLPCKARRFLSDISDNKRITIIRHLLKVHNYDLRAHEKIVNSIKTTTYQIKDIINYTDLSGDYIVSFD